MNTPATCLFEAADNCDDDLEYLVSAVLTSKGCTAHGIEFGLPQTATAATHLSSSKP